MGFPKISIAFLGNGKRIRQYCPAAIGAAFSTKLSQEAKVQNSAYRNSSHLGCYCISVSLKFLEIFSQKFLKSIYFVVTSFKKYGYIKQRFFTNTVLCN